MIQISRLRVALVRFVSSSIADHLPQRRILKISMLGAPNSGKSALFNQLIGSHVSAVSSKENTTRHRITGVATDNEAQLVFLDTPGIIPPWKYKRFYERSLLMDPHSSLWDADLIIAVHDISDRYRRWKLDSEMLRCLFAHSFKESVLVLNKVDKVKRKGELLPLTVRLTDGCLEGHRYQTNKMIPGRREALEYLYDETMKKMSPKNKQLNGDKVKLEQLHDSVAEFHRLYGGGPKPNSVELNDAFIDQNSESSDVPTIVKDAKTALDDLRNTTDWHIYYQKLYAITNAAVNLSSNGFWPNFSQVFMISSQSSHGIGDLKSYLFSKAKPGEWMFDRNILTDQLPQDVTIMTVREKMLDLLPHEVPYMLDVTIEKWEIDSDDDCLRIIVSVNPRRKGFSRDVGQLLRRNGEAVREIARLSQTDLCQKFKMNVALNVSVKTNQKK